MSQDEIIPINLSYRKKENIQIFPIQRWKSFGKDEK
jgi:hypothetical protein